MKLVLSLLMISVLVMGFVGYAEAYEGKIDVKIPSDHVYYYQGDSVTLNGMLIEFEPIQNETVKINIIHPDGTTVHSGETIVNSNTPFSLEFGKYSHA